MLWSGLTSNTMSGLPSSRKAKPHAARDGEAGEADEQVDDTEDGSRECGSVSGPWHTSHVLRGLGRPRRSQGSSEPPSHRRMARSRSNF